MIRCRIRLVFPNGLPRVKVTGTFRDTCVAFDQVRRLYPTAIGVSVVNLGPAS